MKPNPVILSIALMALTWLSSVPARGDVSDSGVRDAKKRLTEAQAESHRAALALSRAAEKIKKQVEGTPEWKDAAAGAREAQSAYTAAAKTVRDALEKGPEFKAAVAERDKRRAERDALRGDDKAKPEERTQAAVAALNADSKVSRMEKDAVAADPAVVRAKQLMQLAQLKLLARRKEFEELAAKDETYQAAKQRLEAANTQVADAQKQLTQAKQEQAAAESKQLDQDLETKRQQLRDAAGFRR